MHAPVREQATAQIGAEFAGDEGGEPVAAALVGGQGQEDLGMALEGAVKDGVLVGSVDRSAEHRAAARSSRVQPECLDEEREGRQ